MLFLWHANAFGVLSLIVLSLQFVVRFFHIGSLSLACLFHLFRHLQGLGRISVVGGPIYCSHDRLTYTIWLMMFMGFVAAILRGIGVDGQKSFDRLDV